MTIFAGLLFLAGAVSVGMAVRLLVKGPDHPVHHTPRPR